MLVGFGSRLFSTLVALRFASGKSLTRAAVAQDTLPILNDDQRNGLLSLLDDQTEAHARTQDIRHQMNRAPEGLLVGEHVSEAAFLALGPADRAAEAELGEIIAQRLGDAAQTLTPDQRIALQTVRTAQIPGRGNQVLRQPARLRLPRAQKQELVNIAARSLSWTTGSQDFNGSKSSANRVSISDSSVCAWHKVNGAKPCWTGSHRPQDLSPQAHSWRLTDWKRPKTDPL